MKFLSALHRTAFTIFFLTVCLPAAQAQRNVIKFDPQNCQRFIFGFRNVIVLDQRPDTLGTIGYVKLGLSARPVKIQTEKPLGEEIAEYYKALSGKADSVSGENLVVVIYDLMATEDGHGFANEFAFFRFRARYFTGRDVYTSLGVIDTTIDIRAGDVTKKLLRKIDECLCGFYQQLVDTHSPAVSDTVYTLTDIREAELLHRLKMPAYYAKAYPDGIYPTWEDFLQLKYVENRKLVEHKKKHFVAQGVNKKGKPYKYSLVPFSTEKVINPGRIIIFQGIPYKAFEGKFYPMVFSDDGQFHFKAMTSRYNPGMQTFMPVAGAMGGAAGAGVFISINGKGAGKPEEYDFTINWRTGKVVPGRQSVKKPRPSVR
jgi:hypothetical protein